MSTLMNSSVTGVFENHAQAKHAVRELRRAAFSGEKIKVAKRFPNVGITTDESAKMLVGAAAGAIAGAAIGGLYAFGMVMDVVPSFGPSMATGTIGTVLANATLGAVLAALVGAVRGLTATDGTGGGTIVQVAATAGRADEVLEILHHNGALSWQAPTQETRQARVRKGEPVAV